jgi:hypothetical protein
MIKECGLWHERRRKIKEKCINGETSLTLCISQGFAFGWGLE